MAGGSATYAGTVFQAKVAAIFAVHILADEPVPALDLPSRTTPVSIEMETSAPVDDILLFTSDGGRCFINVKRSVQLTRNPNSFLASVLDQFIRLWLSCQEQQKTHIRNWQHPLDPAKDRLVLVTHRERSAAFINPFSRVLDRLKTHGSIAPREALAKTESEQKAFDVVVNLTRSIWERHTGDELSDESLASFLTMTKVIAIDPQGPDKSGALALLRTAVISDQELAELAWQAIVLKCEALAAGRGGADRATFRELLLTQSIPVRGVLEYQADVRQLQRVTSETLDGIAHLAHLDVPTRDGSRVIEIDRAVTSTLAHHASETSLLVIGAPGAGKSGAMYSAARILLESGHPVLAIAVDQFPVRSLEQLSQDMRLQHPVVQVLRNWGGQKQGVLFIDALDASRGGPADLTFQLLIRTVLREAPNWRVVASIREFDLRFGVAYRQLFAGTPVNDKFSSDEFGNVAHLHIPPLTDQELQTVWHESPIMEIAFQRGSGPLKRLLQSPFNLFLLANVLVGGLRDTTGITTQVQLLDLYWSYRVIGNDHRGFAREMVLSKTLDRMLEERALRISASSLEGVDSADLFRLHSEGVLAPSERSGDRLGRISFAHHVLFDYGVARLTLEGGEAPDLADRLTASDQRALFLAPGAMMALQMLWERSDDSRSAFWAKALGIAGSSQQSEFCKMLPARIAAMLTEHVGEWQLIFECLRQPDSLKRNSATFLIRHCIGALSTSRPYVFNGRSAGPWPELVRRLAEIAVGDLGWMFKPLISDWIEDPALLTARERIDISFTARLMLAQGAGTPYESGMVIVGIKAIARTVESAPTESVEALRHLLAEDHVREHGHKELFWISQELKYLLRSPSHCAELVGEVYRAAYCTPLPSSDEVTSIVESRIIGMTSNKRQDFESAQYHLQHMFPAFLAAAPKVAAETFVDCAACATAREHRFAGPLIPMTIAGIETGYQADHSSIWYGTARDYSLFPGLESGLRQLADNHQFDAIDEVITTVIRRNHLAGVWAGMLSAGTTHPEQIGVRLVALVSARPVLEQIDTQHHAGELIGRIHHLLTQDQRCSLELAILAVGEQSRNVLLGCLNRDSIVVPEVREELDRLESSKGIPPNRPPFEIHGGAVAMPEDWWLGEQGVDLSSTTNTTINKAIKEVQGLGRSGGNDRDSSEIRKNWHKVVDLFERLSDARAIPEALLMSGWDSIAEVSTAAALGATNETDLQALPGIDQMILKATDKSQWPLAPEDREKAEQAFATAPSWGSPAPRIAGAGAAMALVRAKGHPDETLRRLIFSLATDPSPAVRHQILSRTNMVGLADPELMIQLCEVGFSEESNRGVLSFFLSSIRGVLGKEPGWFAQRLVDLDDRMPLPPENQRKRDEYTGQLVQVMLRLWLVFDQNLAGARVRKWIENPIEHSDAINRALFILRSALVEGDLDRIDLNQDRIRHRAVWIFEQIANRVGSLLEKIDPDTNRVEIDPETGRLAIGILDQLAGQAYFGSGAFDDEGQNRGRDTGTSPSHEVRDRFLHEMAPTFEALAKVPYPSVTHYLLQTLEFLIPEDPRLVFRLATDALINGREGHYQLESLGADLLVRIVRRYLADYRVILIEDAELRDRLMRALDIFVEAGWPDARRLVYELPEMLR